EFSEISRALAKDDRLGVSLTDPSIVYGRLSPQGPIVTNLKLADRFLGLLAFGNVGFLRGYVFAPGYEARKPKSVQPMAVFFRINGLRFSEDNTGQLSRSGVMLISTLVPLLQSKLPTALPDFARIERADVPSEYVANLRHIEKNISYYARERV